MIYFYEIAYGWVLIFHNFLSESLRLHFHFSALKWVKGKAVSGALTSF